MMQEVAHASMLSERRRNLHAAVAVNLERDTLDPDGAQASLIAHHWEEGGNHRQAASYYVKTATWYGTPDLTRPLVWHGARDPARALDAWKQARRLMMGAALEERGKENLLTADGQILNMGWLSQAIAASEAEPYYVEAMEIARALGDKRTIMMATAAYGRILEVTGSATTYVSTVDAALSDLDDHKDASLKVILTAILCHALRLAGDLRRALQANDEVLTHIQEVSKVDEQSFGISVSSWIKGLRSRILTMMGRWDEARSLLHELAAVDEPIVRTHVYVSNIEMAWASNDIAQATKYAEMLTQLTDRRDHPVWSVNCLAYSGLVQVMRGKYPQAVETLTTALHKARSRNALVTEGRILADLAYAQLRMGRHDQALKFAEEAASIAQRRGNMILLAYAQWVTGGPTAPAFERLVAKTGAELLTRLRYSAS
jgi:adenylate cyclase